MRPKSTTLTNQELEIMKVVWDQESATVRHVYETLLEKRKIAYTTVMTMMKVLEHKGHLKKSRRQKAHIYTPSKPRKQMIRTMVREFVDRVFNGSAEPLLVHLVEDERLSEDELAEFAKMLKNAPGKKR